MKALTSILVVVCLIAIPVSFLLNHSDVVSVNKRVTNIESPCLRYGAKSPECKRSFEEAVLTITHAEACAILRKAGLEVISCAHARLRQEHRRHNERAATAAKEVMPHQPSHTAHQQPSPPATGGSPGQSGPAAPTAPPVNLQPTLSGVNQTVCSVNAAGLTVCK